MIRKLRNRVNKMCNFKIRNFYRNFRRRCQWKVVILREILAKQSPGFLSDMDLCDSLKLRNSGWEEMHSEKRCTHRHMEKRDGLKFFGSVWACRQKYSYKGYKKLFSMVLRQTVGAVKTERTACPGRRPGTLLHPHWWGSTVGQRLLALGFLTWTMEGWRLAKGTLTQVGWRPGILFTFGDANRSNNLRSVALA